LLANALEVADLTHDQLDAFEYMLAGLCDAFEALSVARKNFNPQLFFQFDDGLGYARLGRMEGFGGLGQVQVAARRFLYETELV
jgi:hypothetical protein